MNRAAICAVLLLCASAFACSVNSIARNEKWDGTCVGYAAGNEAKIDVTLGDGKGKVDPECVLISGGLSDVKWTSGAGIKEIKIELKRGHFGSAHRPTCSPDGKSCLLNRSDSFDYYGFFDYKISVTPENGPPFEIDPRLIIQP